jgi:hypothetical protein
MADAAAVVQLVTVLSAKTSGVDLAEAVLWA